jgi:hypothetical protein
MQRSPGEISSYFDDTHGLMIHEKSLTVQSPSPPMYLPGYLRFIQFDSFSTFSSSFPNPHNFERNKGMAHRTQRGRGQNGGNDA